jgi:hypothetical protein
MVANGTKLPQDDPARRAEFEKLARAYVNAPDQPESKPVVQQQQQQQPKPKPKPKPKKK